MPSKAVSPTEPTPDQMPDVVPAVAGIRDRIIAFERIPVSELYANPANFREHPHHQRAAMIGALQEFGVNDVLTVYYSQKYGGKLTLINGHLRKDVAPGLKWPCLITNYNDEEAAGVLLSKDQITVLATLNADKLAALISEAPIPRTDALKELLEQTKAMAGLGGDSRREQNPVADMDEEEQELDPRSFWPTLAFAVPQETLRIWEERRDALELEPHVFLARLLKGDSNS